MNRENTKQRLLALVLLLASLGAAWLMLLQPSLQSKSDLEADLQNKQTVSQSTNSWQSLAEKEAAGLQLETVVRKNDTWTVRGNFQNILQLVAFAQSQGSPSLGITKKGKTYIISW